MSKVIIWHNPRCSKSREALVIAEENGAEQEIVKYLEESPDETQIKEILKMLNVSAREMMRTKEEIYKELGLQNVSDENVLIKAMAENPKLIERPILIKNNRAIIGRPTSIIAHFLNS